MVGAFVPRSALHVRFAACGKFDLPAVISVGRHQWNCVKDQQKPDQQKPDQRGFDVGASGAALPKSRSGRRSIWLGVCKN
jgi:hypothetical protein